MELRYLQDLGLEVVSCELLGPDWPGAERNWTGGQDCVDERMQNERHGGPLPAICAIICIIGNVYIIHIYIIYNIYIIERVHQYNRHISSYFKLRFRAFFDPDDKLPTLDTIPSRHMTASGCPFVMRLRRPSRTLMPGSKGSCLLASWERSRDPSRAHPSTAEQNYLGVVQTPGPHNFKIDVVQITSPKPR